MKMILPSLILLYTLSAKKVKRFAILSIQIVLLAELPAHPVHPGPDGDGEDEIHRIFQRADQRLAEDSHHGHHNGLARQKGEQIAFLVKNPRCRRPDAGTMWA